jgi:hypothetical protein
MIFIYSQILRPIAQILKKVQIYLFILLIFNLIGKVGSIALGATILSGRECFLFPMILFGVCDIFGNFFANGLDNLTVCGIDGTNFDMEDFQMFEFYFSQIQVPVFIPVLDFLSMRLFYVFPIKVFYDVNECLLLKIVNKHAG